MYQTFEGDVIIMKLARFVKELKSANISKFALSFGTVKVSTTTPMAVAFNKNLTSSLIATFFVGKTQLVYTQGVAMDYVGSVDQVYQQQSLNRVDYLDNLTLSGFSDFINGSFDLVFLQNQLEEQGITEVEHCVQIIQNLANFMEKKVNAYQQPMHTFLSHSFDDSLLEQADVSQLLVKDAGSKLIDKVVEMQMSEIGRAIAQAEYRVDALKVDAESNLYRFVSGHVYAYINVQDLKLTAIYQLIRKYPLNFRQLGLLPINDTRMQAGRTLTIDGKLGQLSIDFNDIETALSMLDQRSSLLFKLQSLHGQIIRQNQLTEITQPFDVFYQQHYQDA